MKKKLFKDTFYLNVIFITLITFLIEIIFRILSQFEIFSCSTLRILLSTFLLSLIITYLSSLARRKWLRNTINILYVFIYSMYAWLQIGAINYLGVYMSFNTSSQLGAVVDYIAEFLASIKIEYYLLFLPLIFSIIAYLVLFRKRKYYYMKFDIKGIAILGTILLVIGLYSLTLSLPFMQNKLQIKSNEKLFWNPDIPTVAVNQFGTSLFGIMDLKSYIFPTEEIEEEYKFEEKEESKDISRKVSSTLDEIAKSETNKKYSTLNNYFASQKITDYNEYTGMFEGKNVVVVLLESVNDAMINEEYFPNFTKMYNEGWHWSNSFSPRNSCATGNNEFSAMTGLYSIYNTCTSNVYKNNKYFESIFGIFNDAGYKTTSFHNFVEWYYYRATIHPNMGSSEYYGAKKLGIKTASYYGEWPSDIELMEKAFDIILKDDSGKPFMTFITTVSSHQPYSNNSTYGDLHRSYFKNEGYSNTVSRYLSKLKVVDDALGKMLEKLEEAGKLEDTVIVMLADHYPYGLNKSYIKEMIEYDLSDYNIERTPFVIYNPKMDKKEFTEYTSYVNLLPTIANLTNVEYDPRLYVGTDLLSPDYESRVVFADGSWKNEKAYYNASTGKMKYYTEEEYEPEEIKQVNIKVTTQIDMSSKAVKANYFDYLKKKIDEYNLNNQEKEETEEKNEEVKATD